MVKTTRTMLFVLLIGLFLILDGCSKKTKPEEAPTEGAAPVSDSAINAELTDSDSGRALGLQTVHYAYDSSVLNSKSKAALDENVKVLTSNPSLKVQIEGHCDEKGGIQYNIALGERRANSAKAYLADRGVNADRLSTISYGKEKPLDLGHDESAWSKNRRANFRITEK